MTTEKTNTIRELYVDGAIAAFAMMAFVCLLSLPLPIHGAASDKEYRRYSLTERREILVDKGQPFTVRAGDGSVFVRGNKRDDIKIKAIKTAFAIDLDDARQASKQIRFSIVAPRDRVTLKTLPAYHATDAPPSVIDYSIKVPVDIDVEVETTGGDVNLSGIDGRIEIVTASGTVRLNGLKGSVEIHSDHGNIKVIDCPGTSVAETDSGEINYTIRKSITALKIELTTIDGDVRFTFPEGEPITFAINAGDGEIDAFGARLEETDDVTIDNLTGSIIEASIYLSGKGGVPVYITTGGGNVYLDNVNPSGVRPGK